MDDACGGAEGVGSMTPYEFFPVFYGVLMGISITYIINILGDWDHQIAWEKFRVTKLGSDEE